MSLSAQIAIHIPSLRSFACALYGNVDRGDEAIHAMLEAIVADVSLLPSEMPVKVALYRILLSRAWPTSRPRRDLTSESPWLAERAWQALLLLALEDFQDSEISTILSLPMSRVEALAMTVSDRRAGVARGDCFPAGAAIPSHTA